MDYQRIIDETKIWIERFVLGLTLCPFAYISFNKDQIIYTCAKSTTLRSALQANVDMVMQLSKTDPNLESNGFVVFEGDTSFDFTLQLKDVLDAFLEESGLSDDFQTVAFHPDFRFEGESRNAHGNFVNRSPYAMIHILRVEEVSSAQETLIDVDQVPLRNKKLLEKFKLNQISDVFLDDFNDRVTSFKKQNPNF